MIDIKFRAWDKEDRKLFTVADLYFPRATSNVARVNLVGGDVRKLEEVELMQYTGLNDKNGVEIYEGDIIKCDKRGYGFYRSVVKYNDEMARFDVVQGKSTFPMILEEVVDDISISGADYEVIGNIYENE